MPDQLPDTADAFALQDGGGTTAAPSGNSVKEAVATAADDAKSIILFSDGTGNSSAKLFKTNVWRMYEAVDLGPPQEGERKQIAFYDNGVGTSGFKPLAIIGGVFGVGLKRNVLDIYCYACRNYAPGKGQHPGEEAQDNGDHIYGFGFSRGGFTMRTAIAMIAKVGLVITADEAELDKRSKEAWRAYRAGFVPRSKWAPVNIWRWLRYFGQDQDQLAQAAVDAERVKNYHPVIRFVGVWDTVAAYGGPIAEITEAIDNWVVRLSMPNYRLADSVRCARHALSIDDERDAFHPLLWDELHEERRIADARDRRAPSWINEDRLEQVWFTGMHADVGGGYPDESLSYVSFLWMMEEAYKAKLRPSAVMLERFHALASSAGPIHNSRAGVGSYYRYQPRRIGIWLEPIEPQLLARRHPDRHQGLIRSAKIHESVAARIATGTDRYAPIPLPATVKVVPPQSMGENSPPPAGENAPPPIGHERGQRMVDLMRRPRPLVPEELRRRFEDPAWNAWRVRAMRPVWSLVLWRRVAYFVSLFLTLALVLMPVWDDRAMAPFVLSSGHGLIGSLIALLGAVLPGFLVCIVAAWANNPFYFLLLLGGLLVSNGGASILERRLRDKTRGIWNRMIDLGTEPAPEVEPETGKAREPWLRRYLRWRLVPFLVFVTMLIVALWLFVALVTRIGLSFYERGSAFCSASDPVPGEKEPAPFLFKTAAPCHAAGLTVRRGDRYIVQMEVVQPWWDAGHAADPRGLGATEMGISGIVGVPLRRAVSARYLQPILHVRGGRAGPWIAPLEMERDGNRLTMWRGEFVAGRSGELSLFANDAILLPDIDRLYANNRGLARVTIVPATHVAAAAAAESLAAGRNPAQQADKP